MTGDRFDPSSHEKLIKLSDEISEISARIGVSASMVDAHPEIIMENRRLIERCSALLRELNDLRTADQPRPDGSPGRTEPGPSPNS